MNHRESFQFTKLFRGNILTRNWILQVGKEYIPHRTSFWNFRLNTTIKNMNFIYKNDTGICFPCIILCSTNSGIEFYVEISRQRPSAAIAQLIPFNCLPQQEDHSLLYPKIQLKIVKLCSIKTDSKKISFRQQYSYGT